MDIPTINGADMQTVVLLGTWLFIAIQFAKGKVWGDKWTAHISIATPVLLAWVPVWGSPKMNAYAQAMAIMFLIATGFWTVFKAASNKSTEPPQQG